MRGATAQFEQCSCADKPFSCQHRVDQRDRHFAVDLHRDGLGLRSHGGQLDGTVCNEAGCSAGDGASTSFGIRCSCRLKRQQRCVAPTKRDGAIGAVTAKREHYGAARQRGSAPRIVSSTLRYAASTATAPTFG
jgi:hypothetical protein